MVWEQSKEIKVRLRALLSELREEFEHEAVDKAISEFVPQVPQTVERLALQQNALAQAQMSGLLNSRLGHMGNFLLGLWP